MAGIYETYTYEEIKALPNDQKVLALKELKETYPDNKDLAKHLDVAHIAISNMVGKYLEGKQVGRKKMTEEEKAQAKAERKLKKQQEEKMQQEQEKQEAMTQQANINQESEVKNSESDLEASVMVTSKTTQPQSDSNSFSINLNKNMLGEEAISRLSGIANSLLKENKYKVNLIIEETEEV